MDLAETRHHNVARIAWASVLIWWGLAIVIEPVTIGMTATGTGLILLGANMARSLKGIPWKRASTEIGVVGLVWGTVDHVYALPLGISFAVLLIVIGVAQLVPLLIASRAP